MRAENDIDASRGQGTRAPVWVLLLGLGLPTAVTWLYFYFLAGSPTFVQQGAYAGGKTIQFLLPVWVWWCWPKRETRVEPAALRTSLIAGVVSGVIISATAILLYHFVLVPLGIMEGPRQAAMTKLSQLGLKAPWVFLSFAGFYALIHSGLEEYYWRWFVFRRLRDHVGVVTAVVISSLGFMAHHVLVVALYFGWTSPWTYLFSLCVAVGGIIWASLYYRWGTLYGAWLSHGLVDAALFYIAYQLVFSNVIVST